MSLFPLSFLCFTPFLLLLTGTTTGHRFDIAEATIDDIQAAFKQGALTSRQLVQHYIHQVVIHNPILNAVIEINPDALEQADQADRERSRSSGRICKGLHGIPILLKDNIATKDGLNTTAGSLALLGSVVPRDAWVVERLRRAGVVIFGKASMSEWAQFRSKMAPNGWCARSGQGRNPYVFSADPCGSSSGSAIAVAANMVAVSLGTETDGSIICPSAENSVVLEAIVGFDKRDAEATRPASAYIPRDGYRQFLKMDGLSGKRLGILRTNFFEFRNGSIQGKIFEEHFSTMRQKGAILVDNLEINNEMDIFIGSIEELALLAEFKISLNAYLSDLLQSPVKSLLEVIAFNNNHSVEERVADYGQQVLLDAQNTSGLGPAEQRAIAKLARLSHEGLERLMMEETLDAVVTPGSTFTSFLAVGGYPGISVPAGYDEGGVPIGICFGGLKGWEPKLIEIAYAFEQATKVRKLPSFKHKMLRTVNGDANLISKNNV